MGESAVSAKIDKAALVAYLEAWDDDDLSDAMWQAMIEEGVKFYNNDNGTNIDPFDGWLIYINEKENQLRGEK